MVRYGLKVMSLLCVAMIGMNVASAEDSSQLMPEAAKPGSVFLLAQGYFDKVSDPNSEQQHFAIPKACPPNFKPYVTISMSKMAYSSSSNVLQGYGICVNGLASDSSQTGYIIGYLVSRQFANVTRNNNVGNYVGTARDVWSIPIIGPYWNRPMPSTSYMNNTQHDYAKIGGIYWNLYCYPDDQPMPLDEGSSLADPNNPAHQGCAGGETAASNPY